LGDKGIEELKKWIIEGLRNLIDRIPEFLNP
jgi:hypothetical protein